MFVHELGGHRLESADADVQGDECAFDAAPVELLQELLREMQAGRGSGDRSGFTSPDGLVARAVLGSIGACDVGRQGHMPERVEMRLDLLRELDGVPPVLLLADDDRFDLGAEEQAHADPGLAPGPRQAMPSPRSDLFDQQQLDEAAGVRRPTAGRDSPREEPRRNHLRVVEDHQIAGVENLGQVDDSGVPRRPVGVQAE